MEGYDGHSFDDTPEDLRQLRNQKQEIENSKARSAREALNDIERKALRKQIRELGEEPCA